MPFRQRSPCSGTSPLRPGRPAAICGSRAVVHLGAAVSRDGDLFGSEVNRAARRAALARGGQTLLTGSAAAEVKGQLGPELVLRDHGEQRLRGLREPERVFELLGPGLRDDFPPIVTVPLPTLPAQTTTFIGRADELAAVEAQLRSNRLVTITGLGGVGKTRLSLRLADMLAARYGLGARFVDPRR